VVVAVVVVCAWWNLTFSFLFLPFCCHVCVMCVLKNLSNLNLLCYVFVCIFSLCFTCAVSPLESVIDGQVQRKKKSKVTSLFVHLFLCFVGGYIQ
jgi:hypothetical protein